MFGLISCGHFIKCVAMLHLFGAFDFLSVRGGIVVVVVVRQWQRRKVDGVCVRDQIFRSDQVFEVWAGAKQTRQRYKTTTDTNHERYKTTVRHKTTTDMQTSRKNNYKYYYKYMQSNSKEIQNDYTMTKNATIERKQKKYE